MLTLPSTRRIVVSQLSSGILVRHVGILVEPMSNSLGANARVRQGCVEELLHGLTRLSAVSHSAAQSRRNAAGQRRTTIVMTPGPNSGGGGVGLAARSEATHCVRAMCTKRDKRACGANTTAISQLRRHVILKPC